MSGELPFFGGADDSADASGAAASRDALRRRLGHPGHQLPTNATAELPPPPMPRDLAGLFNLLSTSALAMCLTFGVQAFLVALW